MRQISRRLDTHPWAAYKALVRIMEGSSEMKITAIKTLMAFGGRQSWVFVLVETDAGITGVGEASIEGKERAVAAAVDELARFVVGRDPTCIEQNWQIMYRHGFWRGGVVLNSALSGIEQALWDVCGKELGVPVWRLLGGAARDRIELYTHCGGATPDDLARNAQALAAQGWRGLKTGSVGFERFTSEKQCVQAFEERIRLMRDAVGPDVKIMVDAHGRHTPGQALKMIRAVEPYDLYFFEEPVPPDNVAAFARLAAGSLNVNVATGERLFTKWEYAELLEKQYVDIIQPDVCHDGGILETRKIAAMAEAYYVRVAPHNPNGPVATAASLQLAACLPSFCVLEYAQNQPWRDQVIKKPLEIVDGYVPLPQEPGLGVELDLEAIAKLPYEPRDYHGAFWPDGGVADI
ncbi:MAG: galactonate dehydratase [Chloroflexi bacterium]|nr:galactonate dehydratase [Chloroflexota bacterium]